MNKLDKNSVRQSLHLIDRWLDFQTYYQEIPGIAVGIFLEDEIVLKREYGYADLEKLERLNGNHLFKIASHSKLFTATAIMKLYHQEKLSIDDRVFKNLPWFTSVGDENLKEIRIRHLLSHSSGLNRDGGAGQWYTYEFPDKDNIIEQIREGSIKSIYPASEHLKYSNIAFTLLGMIVEEASGISYEKYIQSEILNPLNMKQTYAGITPKIIPKHASGYKRRLPGQKREKFNHVSTNIMIPATGFSSNAEDLLKFYQAHFLGNQVLFPDSIKREMQRVHFQSENRDWGLGFFIDKYPDFKVIGHSGGFPGFITYSGMIPDQKLIVVVLTNAIDGPAADLSMGILKLLYAVSQKKDQFFVLENQPAPNFRNLIGFYSNDWGVTLYSQIGNKLTAIAPDLINPAPFLIVYDQKGDREFVIPPDFPMGSPGESIRFLEKDGETVIDVHGNLSKRFEYNY